MPDLQDATASVAPEKSSQELVADELEAAGKPPAEVVKEPAEEVTAEAEELAKEEVPAEEVDEVDEILKEPEDEKSNTQKRIDRIVAEKKALEERLQRLEAERAVKEGREPEYTPAQLRTALKKAIDDNDADLVWDILEYKEKQTEKRLVKMYEDEKNKAVEQAKRIQTEWDEVTSGYDKYRDPKNELYPGSSKDLDLADPMSLFYQVALKLYSSEEPDKKRLYQGPGGQAKAVADAYALIISRKMGTKSKDIEKERLKKQLLKEKRKKSVVGGGISGEEEKSSRPLSAKEILEDAINERKKYKNERSF